MNLSIEDMISGCKEGNRVAQKAMYDYFASKMLGVCMRYAKDRAEAEDMLQESFIKIFQNLHTYRGEGNFEGWVRRVVVFNAINLYKHRVRHFKEDLDVRDYDAKYDDDVVSKISVKEILAFVQQMPDGYRLIFNLYAVEGFTHKEISEQLGIAIGTSKSQYSRARDWMKKVLSQHYEIMNEPFEEPK